MSCGDENNNVYGVALRIFIIRKSDGSGSVAGPAYQEALLEEIDAAFNPHGIYFLLNCISYIDDTFVYDGVNNNTEGITFASNYQDGNFMTLVIHGGKLGRSGRAPIGNNYAYSAAGSFNVDLDRWDSSVIHELGHSLGLYHTFHGEAEPGTPDLVDGSICCDAGDFICDTPPDPRDFTNILSVNDCIWPVDPNLTDPSGAPYTGVLLENYMSSYRESGCTNLSFTDGQGKAMRNVLEGGAGHALVKRPDALFHANSNTVTSPITYDTDVRVIAGGTARFDGATVNMPAFRKIQVDTRARLIGVNSTFTSLESGCGATNPFWRGIEVSSSEENMLTSTLVSMGNSTIELANNGIYYPPVPDSKPVLPLVFLSDMTFLNNKVSLNLSNDNRDVGSIENQGFVQACIGCTFSIDGGYPNGPLTSKSSEIKLGHSRDFWCVDCDLSLPSLADVAAPVAAIDVVHTRLALFTNCPATSTDPFDCDGNGISRSTITNYEMGVRLMNSDNSMIEDVTFDNVQNAVLATGSPGLRVRKSQFDVNSQNNVDSYSISMESSPSFVIDKNSFILSSQSVIGTQAIWITSNGENEAVVTDNYFQGFGKDVIRVAGLNSSLANGGLSGLRVYCNDFNNPNIGPSVASGPYDIGVINSISNMARFQGSLESPAGNMFSSMIGTGPNDFNILNRGNQVIEYVYSVSAGAVRANPVVSNGVLKRESSELAECLDFSTLPNGLVVNYDTVQNQVIRILQLESQGPGSSNPAQIREYGRKLSGKYVKASVDALRLEHYLELDTNSIASLPQLLDLADMRTGYLASYQKSLIAARYGDYSLHDNLIKGGNVPTAYGPEFQTGMQQYLDVSNMIGQAKANDRSLGTLSEGELDSLRSLVQTTNEGVGGAYAASVLAIYYDEYLPRASANAKVMAMPSGKPNKPSREEIPRPATLFPNPATNQVTLIGADEGSQATIIDLQGRVFVTVKSSQQRTVLDLALLPRGMYLVRYMEGGMPASQRLLKQ